MKRIESRSNSYIRFAGKVADGRNREFCFLEGRKLIEDAIQSQVEIRQVFLVEEAWRKEKRFLSELEKKGCEILVVPSALMRRLSEVETPSGWAAIAKRPEETSLKSPIGFGSFLFSIRDPGNFGTIVRSAEASGCEFVAYTFDCVDPFQPKVVRASTGSIFHVPLMQTRDPLESLSKFKEDGVRVYGLVPRGGEDIFQVRIKLPAIVVIGSESTGIPNNLPLDVRLSIPMAGRVESLNAASAATICFYRFRFLP